MITRRLSLFGYCLLALLFVSCSPADEDPVIQESPTLSKGSTSVTIANWNLHRYGSDKGYDSDLVAFYAEKLSRYDLVFVQEITASEEVAFQNLCDAMGEEYECAITVPAGRSTYTEQYGVFWREPIELVEWNDLAESEGMYDLWARPPLVATWSVDNATFTTWNIHITPSDAEYELGNLYGNIDSEGLVVVLGDLNADCSYFDAESSDFFSDWDWVVPHHADTTVSDTDCAYDRILVHKEFANSVIGWGIDDEDISLAVSDHYLVWAEIAP